MRSVGRTRREVNEERLVRGGRFLLLDPTDRLVGQVFHQVVAIFGGSLRFDRRCSVVQCWVVLVVLAADETVEMLEAGTSWPVMVWADWCRLENRYFVAFAEL